MTRASTCTRLLAVWLVPLLGQPVLAQDDEEGVFDRTPKSCILASSIDQTDAIDDQNILFYMRDRGVYRNTLPRKCPGLERENRMSYELTGTRRLCSTDTITVLEQTGLGAGGIGGLHDGFTCRLGEFVPLSPEEIEDLELLADENRSGRRGRRTQSTIETSEVELPKAETAGEAEDPAAAEPPADESNR
jgi:hypothetical protein